MNLAEYSTPTQLPSFLRPISRNSHCSHILFPFCSHFCALSFELRIKRRLRFFGPSIENLLKLPRAYVRTMPDSRRHRPCRHHIYRSHLIHAVKHAHNLHLLICLANSTPFLLHLIRPRSSHSFITNRHNEKRTPNCSARRLTTRILSLRSHFCLFAHVSIKQLRRYRSSLVGIPPLLSTCSDHSSFPSYS